MALLPIGPQETQESMFEDPEVFPDEEMYVEEGFPESEPESELEPEMSAEPEIEPEHAVLNAEPLAEPRTIFPSPALSSLEASTAPAPNLVQETEPVAGAEVPASASIESASVESDSVESAALPLTVDDFAALEERVLRAVGLVRRERQARSAAEERALKAESQLSENLAVFEKVAELQQEVDSLRQEREQVRQRVERLLSQLDALEL